jgi:hypothetical protein
MNQGTHLLHLLLLLHRVRVSHLLSMRVASKPRLAILSMSFTCIVMILRRHDESSREMPPIRGTLQRVSIVVNCNSQAECDQIRHLLLLLRVVECVHRGGVNQVHRRKRTKRINNCEENLTCWKISGCRTRNEGGKTAIPAAPAGIAVDAMPSF